MIYSMRRGYQTVSLLIGLAGISLSAMAKDAPLEAPKGPMTDTTVCLLRSSPAEFEHKQIRVNAYLSLGFGDRSMHDPSCLENSFTNGIGRIAMSGVSGWSSLMRHSTKE